MPDAETGDTRGTVEPFKYIQFGINNLIARLTLSHAPHNVLTVPMMKEMAEAIESLNGRAMSSAFFCNPRKLRFPPGSRSKIRGPIVSSRRSMHSPAFSRLWSTSPSR